MIKYSALVRFFANFQDGFIVKKFKDFLINFNFDNRHTPFQKTKKYYLNKKYFIENFYFNIYDFSNVDQLLYFEYEKNHFKFYLNSFLSDEIFIDIGSNIGTHSFFILKYLNPSKVLSIDPQKICIYLQKKTLSTNKDLNKEKIEFINSAVGDFPSELKLFRSNSGSATLANDFGSDSVDLFNIEKHNISNISIEDIFKKLSKKLVTIKIDVQGSEEKILDGIYNSNSLINIKNIIFEINNTNMDVLKIVIQKYLNKYKLIDLNYNEISILEIEKHRDLVLSKI